MLGLFPYVSRTDLLWQESPSQESEGLVSKIPNPKSKIQNSLVNLGLLCAMTCCGGRSLYFPMS